MIFLVFKHTTAIIIIILNYRCYTQADILPIFSLLISKHKVLFFALCVLKEVELLHKRSWATKQTRVKQGGGNVCTVCTAVHREWAINHGQSPDRQSAIGDWSRGIDWSVCLPELSFSCLLLVLSFALRMMMTMIVAMMRCSMMWFAAGFVVTVVGTIIWLFFSSPNLTLMIWIFLVVNCFLCDFHSIRAVCFGWNRCEFILCRFFNFWAIRFLFHHHHHWPHSQAHLPRRNVVVIK